MAVEQADSFFDPLEESEDLEDFYDVDVAVNEDVQRPDGPDMQEDGQYVAVSEAGPRL